MGGMSVILYLLAKDNLEKKLFQIIFHKKNYIYFGHKSN
jgi:hypothetical protein